MGVRKRGARRAEGRMRVVEAAPRRAYDGFVSLEPYLGEISGGCLPRRRIVAGRTWSIGVLL